jgi:predicted small lipoprotein YifL
MKIFYSSALLVLAIACITGCGGKGPAKKESKESAAPADSISVHDTGYTGIKKYMSGRFLVKEITFKNGVKEGLMKTYYVTGELRHTFWYENGLREDSSTWYYQEGQKFRVTPFKRDTVDGIQKQYYREGRVKAKIGYSKGLRTPFFQEFTPEGKLVSGYPSLIVSTEDKYKTKGTYTIVLALSNKSTNVRYWRGEFTNGLFDTVRCEKVRNIKGIGTIELKKTGAKKTAYVGVITEVLTNFGNNYLIYKKIELPYNDLK